MTLARIFLFSIVWTVSPAGAGLAVAPQFATAQSAPTQSTNSTPQDQPAVPAQKPSSDTKTPSIKSTPKKKATSSSAHSKQKKTTPGCGASAATAGAATSGTQAADPSSTGNPSGQTSAATTTATNCPPPKIVVIQGGTSEPSVELAGGGQGKGQATQERATANQMAETAESNLKKLGERNLSANEQDTVSQVRRFLTESRAAVAAGDLERARTLAWKAQLLSEDLVKPPE